MLFATFGVRFSIGIVAMANKNSRVILVFKILSVFLLLGLIQGNNEGYDSLLQ